MSVALRCFQICLMTMIMLAISSTALGGWLRPLDGTGSFYSTCDVVTLPDGEGNLDVVAMVAIPHREITFVEDSGQWRARVKALVEITGPDGSKVTTDRTIRLQARNSKEAASGTLQQLFTLVLQDVPWQSGQFVMRLEDMNRRRPGLVHLGTKDMAFSLVSADWYAPPVRSPYGLSIGDAMFMALAPINTWENQGRPVVPGTGGPWAYLNPTRRYGLEASSMQLYVTIDPPALAEDRKRASQRDIMVQVTSDELDFALVDTIKLTHPVRTALAAGRPAALYWQMDAGGLPPGAFRLGIAPLDTTGRGILTSFDMVWDLASLARATDDLLGEGRTVFYGDQLATFESLPRVEQEVMLDEFWSDLDPSPGDAYNEVYALFRARAVYVNHYLGGYDDHGAREPRGRVYMLLGEPDSILENPLPSNDTDLRDARVQVFERYANERPGSTSKNQIPLPYSFTATQQIKKKVNAAETGEYQLWRYDDGGHQLFKNSYSGQGSGLRFLFVDKFGEGRYVLETTTARKMGD